MKCDYCFYCDESQKREIESYGLMTEQTLKNVIRKTLIPAEGYIVYAFQGGEPTLCGLDFFKKVLEYQKQYNKNNITINNALQTNGYQIDEKWCEFLHDNQFLVGVSIDGTEEIHNQYRHSKSGEDSYERIYKTTQMFDQYQVEYNILTVVHKNVAENINAIYEEYKKKGWKYQQYIACLDPLEEKRGQKEYALLPEEYGRFLVKLFDLWYGDFVNGGNQPFIRTFENYVAIAKGYPAESCEQRGVCGIQYVIEGDGSVYPCDFFVLDDYKLGNFNEDRIIHVDERRAELGFIVESQKLTAECKACEYFLLCRGGCQRNRERNEEGTYENYFCQAYRIFFAACKDRIMELTKYIQ